jgi:hypothetical protein
VNWSPAFGDRTTGVNDVGHGGVGIRAAAAANDLAFPFFPVTSHPSSEGGQCGGVSTFHARRLWVPAETGGWAFKLSLCIRPP